MKRNRALVFLIILLINGASVFAQPSLEWAGSMAGGFYESLADQVVDSDGSIYSVGTFTGTVDFDPSPGVFNLTSYAAGGSSWPDVYVTKVNGNGILVWAINIGSGSTMDIMDIALDPNGFIVMTGSFQGTVDFDPGAGITALSSLSNARTAYVWKLDTNGAFVWAKNPTQRTEGMSVTVDSNGDVYAALNTFNPAVGQMITFPNPNGYTFASASNNFYVWKLNSANGNTTWVKYGSGADALSNRSMISNSANEIILAGSFTSNLNLLGFGGSNSTLAAGVTDGFVLKLNSSGVLQWGKTFPGSSSWLKCNTVHLVDNSSFLVGGDFSSNVDFDTSSSSHIHTSNGSIDGFLLEMDFSNNVLFSYTFGGSSFDLVQTVSSNYVGDYYIGGRFGGTSDMDGSAGVNNLVSQGDSDAYFQKLNSSGSHQWAIGYGSAGYEILNVINSFGDSVYCGGEFRGTIDFDPGVPVSNMSSASSNSDPFILKFSECLIVVPVPDVTLLSDISSDCSVSTPASPTASNCLGAYSGTPDVSFPITAQGTTVVTWTYDDGNGNTSTQTQNVVITDITAPVADIAILSNVTSECSVTSLTAPTATDNCIGSITGTHNATLPITAQGTTVVTWTYNDGNGNTSTQTQNVVITDITAPVADIAILSNVTSDCSVTSLTAPTATDNCAGTIIGTHNATLPITAQGTTTVTWTYDDGNGNTSTQTQDVVITDVTAPVADISSLADVASECEVTSLTAPTATDNCVGSITGTHNATLPITAQGTTTVTWTYDDGNGNTSTQTQNVVITDVTAPVADQASLTAIITNCEQPVTSLTAPTATDNCAGTIAGTHNATLPITSSTTVVWTYDDGNGNTSTQNQTVTINIDNTAPVADLATLSNITSECSVASLTAPTATDNCAGSITGTHNATLPITAQGTTMVTWTYDDGNGNTSTQTQNVVITDVTAPVADVASLSNVTSECSVTSLTPPTAMDNCTGTITGTHNATLPITAQGTTVVTWTYDDGNGNTSTQTQNVVITDVTAPVADLATLSNITSECSVTSLIAPTATDNCAGSITGTHNATLPITSQGTTVVTWTYDDGNGNTSAQTQNVVITDVTAPVANVASLSNLGAQCSISNLPAPTATDNCAGSITGTHNATLPITTQGTTVVTWTYDDGNGNTSSQTQNVVITNDAPVANIATLSNVTSECSVTSLTAPHASDFCSGSITGTHNATLPITTQGTTVITWTYDDGDGNTSTQTQDVIITPIDNTVTQIDATTLSANASGYTYQWVDCDNGNQAIVGETNQTFVATVNGNYAVEIDNGTCSVISNCTMINQVGIEEIWDTELVEVYPNPTNGAITISSKGTFNRIEVLNSLGQKVKEFKITDTSSYSLEMPEEVGVYLVKIYSNESLSIKRVVKR